MDEANSTEIVNTEFQNRNNNWSLDRKATNVRWLEDSRTRVFGVWLTVMLATTTVLLGVGSTTAARLAVDSNKLLTIFMVLGTVVAIFTDIGTTYIKWGAIREGVAAEREMGLTLSSFHDFDSGYIRESRFVISYLAGIVYSLYAVMHAFKML